MSVETRLDQSLQGRLTVVPVTLETAGLVSSKIEEGDYAVSRVFDGATVLGKFGKGKRFLVPAHPNMKSLEDLAAHAGIRLAELVGLEPEEAISTIGDKFLSVPELDLASVQKRIRETEQSTDVYGVVDRTRSPHHLTLGGVDLSQKRILLFERPNPFFQG